MSAKKTASSVPAEKLAIYEKLVASVPGVERKGATVPYTSLNGNMFSYLDKAGSLALRLPAEARETFVAKYKTAPVISYGAVMKEYVAVPQALLANTRELRSYFEMSVAYAKSLKAKPTTRRPAAKKAGAAKKGTMASKKSKR